MNSPEDKAAPRENAQPGPVNESRSEPTGLPGLRTWREVYLFVIICFVVYVALLTIFSLAFS
jgi:hypothetical protein